MHRKGLTFVEVLVIIAIIGILLAITLPWLAMRRESTHCCACRNNLKQLGLVFHLYADENDNSYPPLSETKNNFIFNANIIYPDYLLDADILVCPHATDHDPETAFQLRSINDHSASHVGEVHPDCITDRDYIYLGWDIRSDEEAEAFFEVYDKYSHEITDRDILQSSEIGNSRKATLTRLSMDLESLAGAENIYAEECEASTIPVMWDRPYTDPLELNHLSDNRWGPGGFVLYLDGHVEYVLMGEKFPMTETMARLLEERPREPIPDCEE